MKLWRNAIPIGHFYTYLGCTPETSGLRGGRLVRLANGRRAPGGHRGWLGDAPSSRSALRATALAECFGLAAGQRPPAEIAAGVRDAFGRDQAVAVEPPAVPLGLERSQVALAEDPQQAHHGPGHAVAALIPRAHGGHAASQQRRAGLARQQAAKAQLTKPIRREVPAPPVAGGILCPGRRRKYLQGRGLAPRGLMQMPIV